MQVDAGAPAARRERAFYEERRKARARAARFRRCLVVGVAAVLLALAVGTGIGFAGSSDRIADGVRIAGVDVGGMTAAEAKRALGAREAQAASRPTVFVVGAHRFSIAPSELGIEIDWDAAIADALGKGDGFVLFRGFRRLALRVGGADVEANVSASETSVAKQVKHLAKIVDRPPMNASIVLESLRPVVRPASTGAELDRAAAAEVIVGAFASLDRGRPVELPVRLSEPNVRQADLLPVAARVRTVLSGPVRLTLGKTRVTVGPSRLAAFLVFPADGRTALAVGGDTVERYLERLAKAFDRSPRDADFALTSRGKVKVVPSREGRELDVAGSKGAILAAALASTPSARAAALPVAKVEAKLTTQKAQAMGIVGVVSTYTTTYGGDPNRIHNVQLVSKLIDDHLIAPGAVFSFNKTTGERNADKGFLEAPVIINGELETGLGGGVCQVSTTVFNAAFEAGLSIEERTNHALYISHYPTGRDATVNYPDVDLKFKNDTGHWLWLRAFAGTSSLTVTLYGTPVDRKVEIETSPLKVVSPPPVKREKDPTLLVGQRVVEEAGQPARSVSVRRIVYDANGKVLYDTVWYSSYRAEPKLVRIGTKPAPKEPQPQQPAATGGGGKGGAGGSGGDQQGGGAGAGSQTGGSQGGGGGDSAGGSVEPPPAPA